MTGIQQAVSPERERHVSFNFKTQDVSFMWKKIEKTRQKIAGLEIP